MADVDRQLDLLMKTLDLSARWTQTFANVLQSALMYYDKDPAAKALSKEFKNGAKPMYSLCSDKKEAEKVALKLDEAGVVYFKGTYDNTPIFIYSDKQKELAEQAILEHRAEQNQGGVVDKSAIAAVSKGGIRTIKNLDLYQAMLFEEHCRENHISIAINESRQGIYEVSFSRQNAGKMEGIKRLVSVELAGEAGNLLKKQLQYENDNYMRIYEKAVSEKEKFYIADLDGKTIEVGRFDIRFNDGNATIRIDRNDKEFYQKVNEIMNGMREVVDLTEIEYDAFVETMRKKSDKPDAERRFEYLSEIDKEHGRPRFSQLDYEVYQKAIDTRALYETKLAMDNPEQEAYQYSFTNNDMRMADFVAFERINKEDVHDKAEAFQPDPVILNDAMSMYKGFCDSLDTSYDTEEYGNQILDGTYSQNYEFDSRAQKQELEEALEDHQREELVNDYMYEN